MQEMICVIPSKMEILEALLVQATPRKRLEG